MNEQQAMDVVVKAALETAVKSLAEAIKSIFALPSNRRKALFLRDVQPVYEQTSRIHDLYLQSFSEYRTTLEARQVPFEPGHPLFDKVTFDLTWSEHTRLAVISLLELPEDERLGPFLNTVREYLSDVRVTESLNGFEAISRQNLQMWRRTFLQELRAIAEGHWQMLLDPGCSMPPLDEQEIQNELLARASASGIAVADPTWLDSLKVRFAVNALDGLVGEMQTRFAQVTGEFQKLRRHLAT